MAKFRVIRDARKKPVLVDAPDSDPNAIALGARLDVPPEVRERIGHQYRAAARRAPEHFPDLVNEEDALSGSFGAVLRDAVRGKSDGYEWRTSAKKVTGRGPGAGEKRYGADMTLEIEVTADAGTSRKTLLIQAKKNWNGKDAKLADQAAKIAELPGRGMVIDYRLGRYRAVSTEDAIKAGGDARRVPHDAFEDVGDVLGGDFLDCRVGSPDIYYDPGGDVMVVADPSGAPHLVEFAAGYRVRTKVQSRGADSVRPRARRRGRR